MYDCLANLIWLAARHVPRRRCRVVTSGMAIALVATSVAAPHSHAHPTLGAYIQHRITLEPHRPHLDVIVELTFFEEPSLIERSKMDANHDGRISRTELDAYARGLEQTTAAALRVLVSGREVTLAPLYPPEVDLLGTPGTVAAHHQLRLHFFGSVSNLPPAGAEIVVEDRLWPSVPALVTLSDSPDHHIRWEGNGVQQKLKPATVGEVRRFKARLAGSKPNEGVPR